MIRPSAEAILKAHTKALMALPGVVGTGVGLCEGEPCIKLYIACAPAHGDNLLPTFIDGYPVKIEVTGTITARR